MMVRKQVTLDPSACLGKQDLNQLFATDVCLPSISARWWRSVVSLRSIIIRAVKRAPEKATAPLALGIVIVSLVPAASRLTVTWFLRPRHLILAARSNAGQYNLGIL